MPTDFPDFEINPGTGVPVEREWWHEWPESIERAVEILQSRAVFLQAITEEGIQLRKLLEWVEEQYNKTEELIREQYPIAFFKPSYEQSLVLNCWWCGYDFPIIFAANRIGKTAICVINGLLWVLPNNPQWRIFQPYTDEFGQQVHVLERPVLEKLKLLHALLMEKPELLGDPYLPYWDEASGNAWKFATLQKLLPEVFTPAWPAPPVQIGGTVWLGAPDNAYHRDIILKEWKRWTPQPAIKSWSEAEGNQRFILSTLETGNPKPTVIEFICKSYEQKDTKWSGAAVLGIILTEGLEPDTLDEIKQRIKENGFASWDYTPYEAANVGKKTALAQRVYEKKEEMPLHSFCFTGFKVKNAPTHILPPGKKNDLLRMWSGKAQGRARIDGQFFSSSPKILSKLDRPFHCLPWTKEELFAKYPTAHKYRSIDPGYDHPTACCWSLLNVHNVHFIYRYYSESGRTISERCKDIIDLSGNTRFRRFYGKKETDYIWVECHPYSHSEVYNATIADYHTFKADETTGQPLSNRYIREGIPIIPSPTIAPADRALDINNALDKLDFYTHPITKQTPSSRLFFLINEPGVDEALSKMEELYWERFKTGDRKGLPKDEVPKDDDDELDVLGQIICAPFAWNTYRPQPVLPPDNVITEDQETRFATLQNPDGPRIITPEHAGFGGNYIDYFIQ